MGSEMCIRDRAGLSYHICGKLEVAFKASPSSQHQHCTDEAQESSLILLVCRLVFVGLWCRNVSVVPSCPFNMSQLFPKSILLHFPSEIYLRRGVGESFPLLDRALHEKEIVAMQFLRGGRVRITVRSEAYREDLLSSEFRFEDTDVPITPADCVAKSVYVRDLPFQVSDKSIVCVFYLL